MEDQANIAALVDEYQTLLGGAGSTDIRSAQQLLVEQGDWSDHAAEHLLQLARNYGSFMLRNALAISLALGTEDGELGF